MAIFMRRRGVAAGVLTISAPVDDAPFDAEQPAADADCSMDAAGPPPAPFRHDTAPVTGQTRGRTGALAAPRADDDGRCRPSGRFHFLFRQFATTYAGLPRRRLIRRGASQVDMMRGVLMPAMTRARPARFRDDADFRRRKLMPAQDVASAIQKSAFALSPSAARRMMGRLRWFRFSRAFETARWAIEAPLHGRRELRDIFRLPAALHSRPGALISR